jgi:hypothetical protein
MNWWIAVLGLAAGAAVAVQFTVNAQLKITANDPIWAALISFLVGTFALTAALVIQRRPHDRHLRDDGCAGVDMDWRPLRCSLRLLSDCYRAEGGRGNVGRPRGHRANAGSPVVG